MRIILCLTLLLAVVFCSGCATQTVVGTTKSPELTIDETGVVILNHQRIQPDAISSALRSAGYKKSQEIHILVTENPDRAAMKAVSADLVRHGYKRTVFVKIRKASSAVTKH